jgi:hypothetical protein
MSTIPKNAGGCKRPGGAEFGGPDAARAPAPGPLADDILPANAVATDSEWDTHLKDTQYGPWLSTTFAAPGGAVEVYVRDDLPDDTRARLEAEARRLGVSLYPIGRSDDDPLLWGSLPDLVKGYARGLGGELPRPDDGPPPPKVSLLFYFSPKDVEYALGWGAWRRAIEARRVRQHNHLAGTVDWVRLRDLSGWPGREKLATFAAAVAVPMEEKAGMDAFKSNMARGLAERPEEFLRYCVADAKVLLQVYGRFVRLFRAVQGQLGFPDGQLWTGDDIPLSCGRLVAETFQRWATLRAGRLADAVRFSCNKLGLLDRDQRGYEKHRDDRAALTGAVRAPEELSRAAADPTLGETLRRHGKARYAFTALDGCGVRWWASQRSTETAPLNALVHGGRCVNERPDQYVIDAGADIDIVGCYGAALRSLVYPVGLPSVWSYTPNEKPPTLGRWLRRHENDLVPGLWTCAVSGRLPFEQDLLVSCLVKVESIRRASDPDGGDIPHDMVLLRRELKNAVVTSDLLEALRRAATNAEWAALMKLELVTAAAYLRQHRAPDAESWCRAVMAAPDDASTCRLEAGTPGDRRCRAWYPVPLEGFVGALVTERKRCKRVARDSLDLRERREAAGKERVLKLMVNTTFGSIACRHFDVGNTVVANCITARARLGAWMLAKALGLRQTITDGGPYQPGAVPFLKAGAKRPGLDTLSRPEDWARPRLGRTVGPLGGRPWRPGPLPPDADAVALEHVRQFWSVYELGLPFTELEHKYGRVCRRVAYVNKADHALLFEEGEEPVFKVRGMQRVGRDGRDRRRHPTFALLDAVLAGSDVFPEDLTYRRGGLLKVGLYRVAQASAGYANLKGLRPGDDIPATEHQARFNNMHTRVPDEATFRRRRDRKRRRRGVTTEWFESHRAAGIAAVHRRMLADDLKRR